MKTKELNAPTIAPAIAPTDSQESIGSEARLETVEELLNEARAEEITLCFGKHKVNVSMLEKALQDTFSDACRLSKVAESKGLGRVAKNMTGGGTLIPTPAIINELYALGDLGLKADKKTAIRKDRLKGLNMLVDGLVLLGVSKRS